MHYATLTQVRAYIKLTTAETLDDSLLTFFISKSVQAIDAYSRRRFDVRREARLFDFPLRKIDRMGVYSAEDFVYAMNMTADWMDQRLRMDDDLLEVLTLTNGDGTEIDSGDYVLKPANSYPKYAIELKSGSGVTWQVDSDGNREQVIDLDSYWGHHPRYGDLAWVDSLDTVRDNPLTAAATSLIVTNSDGTAGDLESPRFQAGQMLKIEDATEDDEFLFVVGVDDTTNVLTVTRGHNGTTAVGHAQGTAIYIYRPSANIVLACTRLVAWRYRQKDADTFDKATIMGTGIAITPSAMPADVRNLLPHPREPGRGLKD